VCAAVLAVALGTAQADPRDGRAGARGGAGLRHMDARFGHNHYYPSRGMRSVTFPATRTVVNRYDHRTSTSGGIWYEPRGPEICRRRPAGRGVVPVLAALLLDGLLRRLPYYSANETTTLWRPIPNQYEVVDPREMTNSVRRRKRRRTTLSSSTRRTAERGEQGKDKYECHNGPSTSPGFDPTQSAAAYPPTEDSRRAQYHARMGAWLEGRGYSVK